MTRIAVRDEQRPQSPPRQPSRRGLDPRIVMPAVLAGLVWLPVIARPLSSDEGGFLMVAAQWGPGSSLYGDYWVDRPPLLIALFALADNSAAVLRLLGIVAMVVSVLLAGRLGRLAAPRVRSAAGLCASVGAVLLASPLLGAQEVNGEMLAAPFVLGGLVCVLEAARPGPAQRSRWWWAAAGVAGACAGLVKQNLLDVAVVAVVVLLCGLEGDRARAAVGLRWFAGAALATAGLAVAGAAVRGTDPVALWNAVVTFRFQAAAVIGASASPATPARAGHLVISFIVSGAPVVVLALLAALRTRRSARADRGRPDLQWPVVALLVWESFGVVFGGSYWLHYLTALVPGLVLATGLVADRAPLLLTWLRRGLLWPLVATVVALVWTAVRLSGPGGNDAVVAYLRDHAQAGDTGVVAFGDPAILQAVGLRSPYENLWSLPVKVRDPRVVQLAALMAGPDRPTWLVVSGATLTSWGVDPVLAQTQLDAHYVKMAVQGSFVVYAARPTPR